VKAQPLLLVTSFSEFSAENDSHGEHDLGRFSLVGRTFFWKIDYFDKGMRTTPNTRAIPNGRCVCSR